MANENDIFVVCQHSANSRGQPYIILSKPNQDMGVNEIGF